MSQLNVDNIQNRTGSNGGPNFPSGITVAVGQTAYIHGNLQVDGTETIVNTETLNVADKTVGIGSTSNASNTTADGAGIEVFASSSQTGNNKTLTWGNTSNSWEFGPNDVGLKIGTGVTANASGVTVTGVVTASSFVGNVTGSGANLTNLPSAQLTGALPAIDGSNLTGIDAAPTVNGTASGSIGANKGVIVKSDGNFEQVVGATVGTGGAEHWYSNASHYPSDIRCAATPDGTTVAIIYHIYDNATNYSYIIIGTTTQNQSDTTISWGTPTQFKTNQQVSNTNEEHVLENIDNDRFLVLYRYAGDLKAKIVTFSGNTPSFGTETAIGSSGSGQADVCLMGAGSNKVFVATRDSSSYEYAFILDCGSSGTTITAGSNSSAGWQVEYPTPCWDPVNSQVIVAYRQGGDCKAIVFSVSGTSITAKSGLLSTGGGMGNSKPAIAFDTNVNRAIIVMKSSNGNTWIFNGVPTAGGITWYSPGSSGSGSYNTATPTRSNRLAYDPITKKTSWIFTKESGNYSTWTSYLTINTTENAPYWTTMTEIQTANAGTDQDLDCCILPSTLGGLTMWTFTRSNASPKTGATKFQQISSTNMTTGNFIGFSDAAYTNGQTAKVKVTGNVTTQSGLTPGQKYYVQFDAGVGTTAQDPSVVAGRALSSTSLLIQPA